MALTELQQKWIADALGVDLRKFPSAPGGQGMPGAAPVQPRPDAERKADAQSPAPADKSREVEITIENASDAGLLIVAEYLSRLSFDGVIPSTLGPGQKVSLKFGMPEVTSDVLVYAAVPAGSSKAPKDAPSWQIKCWIEPGGKLDGESDIDEGFGLKAEKTSDGKGKIVYKLSGKLLTAAATTAATGARLALAIDNQSDRPLRLVKADNDGGRFDPAPPQRIAPKKRAAFAALGSGPKGGTLVYELEVTEGPVVSPDQLVSWKMSWAPPAQPGQPPQPDSALDPELKGFSPFGVAGKDNIVYKLVGASVGTAPVAAVTPRLDLTIDNQSDRTLRFIKAENDGGRFDPVPPQEIAPKKKVSFAALDTGAKGGTLIYLLEAKEGVAEEPDQLPWWKMSWRPTQAGQPPQPDSTLDPELKGFSPSGGAGKRSVAFMLAGTSAAAAQPGPQVSPAAGQRRIDVTFANQSDQVLKYWGADKMTATFGQKPPDQLKPGASASFAIFAKASDEVHFGLMYSIVPTADAKADANTPKWTPHFTIPAGTAVMVPGSDIVPGIDGLKSSENAGTDAVSFVLSGKAAASAQRPQVPQVPQVPFRPQDVEQRIPITFTNDSDRVLRYWGADKMDVTFDQRPPDLIKPGQSLGFAVRGKRGTPIHFGLMYSIVANETEKAENGTPKWTPHFQIPPAENMIADCRIVPGMGGLNAGGWAEKDGALFVLSGKAVASAQVPQPPQVPFRPQDVEQRIPITFTNDSNMVLRYWGADKMIVTFDRKPPALIKPGQSLGFAVRGKRGTPIHFGLMYSILANETEKAENGTPKWTPHFQIPPAENMIADCRIVPGMGGLNAGGWAEKDGALFVLSGQWAKDQELKTPISIKNATKYKLRLAQSSAAPGRFDPAPPAEIAPGATAICASWAKVESDQKLVYELEAADGTAGADKGSPKRKRWTMTWHTKPGNSPDIDSQVENVERHGGEWGLDGNDGVRFELEIKDDGPGTTK